MFAVSSTVVATPLALVTAVVTLPANVPLAPVAGAANVTVTPGSGLLPASFTVACSRVANAVPMGVTCGVPAVAEIVAAAPAVFESAKFAGAGIPGTDAPTI